ncbi:MED6-domain-containing protein [Wallemia mellicola]|uniref:Mediator of RNA polymerase II transcription subunit 6 n=2 Tax=Wallemia mellicola TaxID=1708541 RepID=A0A4T0TM55_9BASI|nr:MED6-domain-containing protein [Wallemia mellicola CBS 633.66]TIB67732.1 hypothetical protein E3Q24_04094 [Wallemia mellicola]EIM20471.1 MED6-domain-containing protein [Wallemia mellicola CBS 633.66]TIB74402.1 MED6-domain-containing protein [Wallemia mellicola]TIB75961.1 hypothetical protein E3Q23_02098 [Wallemia mellicola]TIB84601.1 MED6-domain-containing protein [Wallemia mellicola]|eukprot:XP_006959497.1 MED6-domain-containing protein [Wallemia mellicola CBS 633.66]
MSEEIDLSSIFWRAPEFLQYYGNTLNDALIMDYFSLSPFYDKKSNNQLIKMQNIANLSQPANIFDQLVHFTGIEFVLAHSEAPDLFIINKQYRHSPTDSRVLAVYYCLNNNIYAAPDGYNALGMKFHSAIFALQSSMKTLRDNLPAYNPRVGYSWQIEPNKQKDKTDVTEENSIPLLKSLRTTRADLKLERERRAKLLSEQTGEKIDIDQTDQTVEEPKPVPTKSAPTDTIKKKKRKSTKSSATSRSSTPATPDILNMSKQM